MKTSSLGRTGLQVSRICLGTMMYGSQNTQAEGFAQMDYALERGINFFDTAEVYAIPPQPQTQGATERIIGNWFQARGNRDKVILASKIAGRADTMTWIRNGPRHTRDHVDAAIEASLTRLQTDYIDLYQLHWPDRRYSGFGFHEYHDYDGDYEDFISILESLDRHVKAGRIRHIGVSNESPWGVMKFLSLAEQHGLPRIASIQNCYNLVSRSFEYGLAEVALREDVGLLAYSPLAQGYLTGKYRHGALPAGARKTLYQRLNRYEGPGGDEMVHRYVDLAALLGVTPVQLALKFIDSRAFTTATIIGASTMDQLKDDIDAFEIDWTKELERAVSTLHASHPNPCP
jgi:aryl-alcohol dehydrogenase-like predicted oxidoreductase